MMIGQNIRNFRKQRGWTILQLATRAEVDSGYLSRLERDLAGFSRESVQGIAKALGVTLSDLFAEDSNVEPVPMPSLRIPILDYVQAGGWTGLCGERSEFEPVEFTLTDQNFSARAFALRIRGDSMLPLFEHGDLVVVDPEVNPLPGDYVVATNCEDEAVFKQYRLRGVNEGGQEVFELVPLNPVYPTLRSDLVAIRIVGTMVEHKRYRRRRK